MIQSINRIVDRRLQLAAEMIASKTREAFTRKSVTPSEPGEYPAKQTGNLAGSIEVTAIENGYQIAVTADYAKYLAGTRKMLGSVVDENDSEIKSIVGSK